ILTIEPKAVVEPTTIKVTVTASDGKGGSVSTSFDVTVNPAASSQDNHDPTVVSPSPLSSLAVTMGMNQEVTLDGVFIDEDGDTLTYVASSADDAIVTVSVTDGILTIEPKAVVEPTTIKVTVTASDGKGGSVSTSFDVTVDPVA
ncbi:MAG: Ig-like domain-containing protein, partial [Clostridia bacterium]